MAYKLSYFDLGGRAEGIRMLLAHSKADWEDIRVSGESFTALKESGKCPGGQVPILELPNSDKVLSQSTVILRYLGIVHGYYSTTDPMAAYAADLAIETVNDCFNKDFVMKFFAKEAASAEVVKEISDKQEKLLN